MSKSNNYNENNVATKVLFLIMFIMVSNFLNAQNATSTSRWKATLVREDGNEIPFNIDVVKQPNKTILYVINASERLRVDSVKIIGDSIFIKMPVFESSFKAKMANDEWNGVWTKGTSSSDQIMKFKAVRKATRFEANEGIAKANVTGRWAVHFEGDKEKTYSSIAEFKQVGNIISGTFITPFGDYRYLEGIVTGNKLKLSGFDGGHAILYTADVTNNKITNGKYYSGAKFKETWNADKNAKATVKADEAAMYLKPGEERLSFRFPDLDSNLVNINDPRFKNKVVVIQLLGSWCPNCMDETAFLSDYYNKNKQKGIEIIALAYEYSTDFQRSVNSLEKFQKRFNVQYPILVTGVTVSDTLRTEKTLPQLTRIKVFPSTIILDKSGKVRKLDTGFYGPGTGSHYEEYKKEFYATIDELLKEK